MSFFFGGRRSPLGPPPDPEASSSDSSSGSSYSSRSSRSRSSYNSASQRQDPPQASTAAPSAQELEEIRQLYMVGTQISVLEAMYDPASVRAVVDAVEQERSGSSRAAAATQDDDSGSKSKSTHSGAPRDDDQGSRGTRGSKASGGTRGSGSRGVEEGSRGTAGSRGTRASGSQQGSRGTQTGSKGSRGAHSGSRGSRHTHHGSRDDESRRSRSESRRSRSDHDDDDETSYDSRSHGSASSSGSSGSSSYDSEGSYTSRRSDEGSYTSRRSDGEGSYESRRRRRRDDNSHSATEHSRHTASSGRTGASRGPDESFTERPGGDFTESSRTSTDPHQRPQQGDVVVLADESTTTRTLTDPHQRTTTMESSGSHYSDTIRSDTLRSDRGDFSESQHTGSTRTKEDDRGRESATAARTDQRRGGQGGRQAQQRGDSSRAHSHRQGDGDYSQQQQSPRTTGQRSDHSSITSPSGRSQSTSGRGAGRGRGDHDSSGRGGSSSSISARQAGQRYSDNSSSHSQSHRPHPRDHSGSSPSTFASRSYTDHTRGDQTTEGAASWHTGSPASGTEAHSSPSWHTHSSEYTGHSRGTAESHSHSHSRSYTEHTRGSEYSTDRPDQQGSSPESYTPTETQGESPDGSPSTYADSAHVGAVAGSPDASYRSPAAKPPSPVLSRTSYRSSFDKEESITKPPSPVLSRKSSKSTPPAKLPAEKQPASSHSEEPPPTASVPPASPEAVRRAPEEKSRGVIKIPLDTPDDVSSITHGSSGSHSNSESYSAHTNSDLIGDSMHLQRWTDAAGNSVHMRSGDRLSTRSDSQHTRSDRLLAHRQRSYEPDSAHSRSSVTQRLSSHSRRSGTSDPNSGHSRGSSAGVLGFFGSFLGRGDEAVKKQEVVSLFANEAEIRASFARGMTAEELEEYFDWEEIAQVQDKMEEEEELLQVAEAIQGGNEGGSKGSGKFGIPTEVSVDGRGSTSGSPFGKDDTSESRDSSSKPSVKPVSEQILELYNSGTTRQKLETIFHPKEVAEALGKGGGDDDQSSRSSDDSGRDRGDEESHKDYELRLMRRRKRLSMIVEEMSTDTEHDASRRGSNVDDSERLLPASSFRSSGSERRSLKPADESEEQSGSDSSMGNGKKRSSRPLDDSSSKNDGDSHSSRSSGASRASGGSDEAESFAMLARKKRLSMIAEADDDTDQDSSKRRETLNAIAEDLSASGSSASGKGDTRKEGSTERPSISSQESPEREPGAQSSNPPSSEISGRDDEQSASVPSVRPVHEQILELHNSGTKRAVLEAIFHPDEVARVLDESSDHSDDDEESLSSDGSSGSGGSTSSSGSSRSSASFDETNSFSSITKNMTLSMIVELEDSTDTDRESSQRKDRMGEAGTDRESSHRKDRAALEAIDESRVQSTASVPRSQEGKASKADVSGTVPQSSAAGGSVKSLKEQRSRNVPASSSSEKDERTRPHDETTGHAEPTEEAVAGIQIPSSIGATSHASAKGSSNVSSPMAVAARGLADVANAPITRQGDDPSHGDDSGSSSGSSTKSENGSDAASGSAGDKSIEMELASIDVSRQSSDEDDDDDEERIAELWNTESHRSNSNFLRSSFHALQSSIVQLQPHRPSLARRPSVEEAKQAAAEINLESDIRGLLDAGTKVETLETMYSPTAVRKVLSKKEAEADLIKMLDDSSKEIASDERETITIKEEFDALKNRLAATLSEKESLQRANSLLEQQKEALLKDQATTQERLKRVIDENELVKAECSSMKRELDEAKNAAQKMANISNDMKKIEVDRDEAVSRLDQTTLELERLTAESKELAKTNEMAVSEMKDQLLELQRSKDFTEEQLEKVVGIFDSLREDKDAAVRSQQDALEQVHGLQAVIADLEAATFAAEEQLKVVAEEGGNQSAADFEEQLALLQKKCSSLEIELEKAKQEQAGKSIPDPSLARELEVGNAHSVDHDPLYGPREPEPVDPEEKGKMGKKKFVSKDTRLKTLEAAVDEQDLQLQKTLVEMEVLNSEKRSLEKKLEAQDEELQQILHELETQGLQEAVVESRSIPKASQGSKDDSEDTQTAMAQLTADHQVSKDRLEQLEQDKAKLESQKDALEADLESMKQKVAVLEDDVSKYSNERARYKAEMDDLLQAKDQKTEVDAALNQQLALLQEKCSSLEIELEKAKQELAGKSIPDPSLARELEVGNAHSVDHDPLYGPREPEPVDLEEKGKMGKKKFVSKDTRLKTLEAAVDEQDLQLQKTLVEMEVLNSEKRSLEKKLEAQDEELQQILHELETRGLASRGDPSPSTVAREGDQPEVSTSRSLPKAEQKKDPSTSTDTGEQKEAIVESRSTPKASQGGKDDSKAMAQLTADHQVSTDRLEQLEQDKAKLESQKDALETDLESLKQKVAVLEDDVSKYSNERARYKAEIDDLLQAKDQETEVAARLNQQLEEAKGSIDTMEAKVKSSEAMVDKLKQEVVSLEEDVSKYGDERAKNQAKIDELSQAIHSERENSASLNQKLKEAMEQRDNLEAQVNSSEAMVDNLRKQVDKIEEESTNFGDERARYKAEIDDLLQAKDKEREVTAGLNHQLEEAKMEIDTMEAKVKSSEAMVDKLKQEVVSLEDDITRYGDERAKNQAEIDELSQAIQSERETSASLNQKLEEAVEQRDNLEAQVNSSKALVDNLQQQVAHVAEETNNFGDERLSYQAEIDKLTLANQQEREAVASLNQQLQETKGEIDTMEAQLKSSEVVVDELKDQILTLEEDITRFGDERGVYKAEIGKLMQTNQQERETSASLNQKLEEAIGQGDTLEAQVKSSEAMMDDLRQQVASMEEDSTRYSEEKAKYQDEIDELTLANHQEREASASLNQQLKEASEKLIHSQDRMNDLESQLGEWQGFKNDLESVLKVSGSNIISLKEKILQLQSDCADAEQGNEKHAAEILVLKQEKDDLASKVDVTCSELSAAQDALAQFETQMSQVSKEKESIFAQKEAASVQVGRLESELKDATSQISVLTADLDGKSKDLQEALLLAGSLRENMSEKQQKKATNEDMLREANQKVASLEAEIEQCASRESKTAEQLAECKDCLGAMEHSRDEALSRLDQISLEIEDLSDEIKELVAIKEIFLSEMNDANTKVLALEDELVKLQNSKDSTVEQLAKTMEDLDSLREDKDAAVRSQQDALEQVHGLQAVIANLEAATFAAEEQLKVVAEEGGNQSAADFEEQLALLQKKCSSLEIELEKAKQEQAGKSIPDPSLARELEVGNAHSVDHDPLYGPREPEPLDPEEKGKMGKKKFVSKDTRLKTLEAAVDEQDLQLQKTLVEMEVLNSEKRSLEKKLEAQDEELQQILHELETQGLVSRGGPSPSTVAREGDQPEVTTSRSLPRAEQQKDPSTSVDPGEQQEAIVESRSIPKASHGGKDDSKAMAQLKADHQVSTDRLEQLEQDKAKLESQKDALETDLESMRQRVAVLEDDVSKYGDERAKNQATVDELSKAIEKERETSASLTQKLEGAGGQDELSRTKIARLEEKLVQQGNVEERMDDMEAQLKSSEALVESLEKKLGELETINAKFDDEKAIYLAEIEQFTERADNEKETSKGLRVQLEEAKGQLQQLQQEKEILEEQLSKQEELVVNKEDLEAQLRSAEALVNSSQEQVSGLEHRINQINDERKSHQDKVDELTQSIREEKELSSELRQQLTEATEQMRQIQQESLELKTKLLEREDLRGVCEGLEADVKSKETHVSKLEQRLEELEEERGSFQTRMDDLIHSKEASSSLQQQLEDARQDLNGIQLEKTNLESQLQEQKGLLAEKESQETLVTSLRGKVAKLEEDAGVLEHALESCKTNLKFIEKERDDVVRQKDGATNRLQSLVAEVAEVRNAKLELEDELDAANGQLQLLQSENAEIKSSFDLVEKQLQEANSKSDGLASELETATSKLLAVNQRQNALLKTSRGEAEVERRKSLRVIEKLKLDMEEASSQQRQLNEEVERTKADQKELLDGKNVAERELAAMESQKDDLDSLVAGLQAAKADLESRLQQAQGATKSLESNILEMKQERDRGHHHMNEMKLQLEEEARKSEKAVADAIELTAELEARKEEVKELKLARDEAVVQRQETSEAIRNLREENADLDEARLDVESELSNIKAKLEDALQELSNVQSERSEAITSLEQTKARLLDLEAELSDLKASHTALKEQLDNAEQKFHDLKLQSNLAGNAQENMPTAARSLPQESDEEKVELKKAIQDRKDAELEKARAQEAANVLALQVEQLESELLKQESVMPSVAAGDLDEPKGRQQQLEDKVGHLQASMVGLEDDLKEAHANNHTLTLERDGALEQLQSFASKLKILGVESSVLQNARSAAAADVNKATEKIKDLENQLAALQTSEDALREESEKAQVYIKNLELERDQAQEDLKTSAGAATDDEMENAKNKIKDLEDQVTDLAVSEDAMRHELEKAKNHIVELEPYQYQGRSLDALTKRLEEVESNQQTQAPPVQGRTTTSIHRLEDANDDIQRLQEPQANLKALTEQRDQALQNANALTSQLEQLESNLSHQQHANSLVKIDLDQAKERQQQLEEQIGKLEAALVGLEDELKEAQDDNHTLTLERDGTLERLQSFAAKLKSLGVESSVLQSARSAADDEVNTATEKIKDLESQLTDLQDSEDALKQGSKKAQVYIKNLELERDQGQEDLEELNRKLEQTELDWSKQLSMAQAELEETERVIIEQVNHLDATSGDFEEDLRQTLLNLEAIKLERDQAQDSARVLSSKVANLESKLLQEQTVRSLANEKADEAATKKMKDMENQLADLRASEDATRLEYNKAMGDIKLLESEKDKSQEAMDVLTTQLVELQGDRSSQEAELALANNDLEEAKHMVEDRVAQLETTTDDLAEELQSTLDNLQALQLERDQAQKRVKSLTAKLEQLEAGMSPRGARSIEATDKLDQANVRQQELEEKVAQFQAAMVSLEDELEEAKESNQTLTLERDNTLARLQSFAAKLGDLGVESSVLQSARSAADDEVKKTAKKVKDLESHLAHHQASKEAMKQELEKARNRILELEPYQDQSQTLDALYKRLEQLETNRPTQTPRILAGGTGTIQEPEAANDDVHDQLQKTQANLRTTTDERDQALQNANALASQLKQLEFDLSNQRQANSLARNDLDQGKERQQHLEEQVGQLQAALTGLEDELKEAHDDKHTLTLERDGTLEQVQSLAAKLKDLGVESSVLQSARSVADDEVTNATEKIKDLGSQLADLQASEDSLRMESANAQEYIKKLELEKNQGQEVLEALKSRLEELEERAPGQKQEVHEGNEKATTVGSILEKQLAGVQSAYATLKKELDEARLRAHGTSKQYEQAVEKLAATADQLKSLEVEASVLKELKSEREAQLKETESTMRSLASENSSLNVSKAVLEHQLKEAQDALVDAKIAKASLADELRTALENASSVATPAQINTARSFPGADAPRKLNANLEHEGAAILRNQLETSQRELETLKMRSEKMGRDLAKSTLQETELKAQLDQLKNQVAEAKERVSKNTLFKDDLSSAEEENQALQRKLDRALKAQKSLENTAERYRRSIPQLETELQEARDRHEMSERKSTELQRRYGDEVQTLHGEKESLQNDVSKMSKELERLRAGARDSESLVEKYRGKIRQLEEEEAETRQERGSFKPSREPWKELSDDLALMKAQKDLIEVNLAESDRKLAVAQNKQQKTDRLLEKYQTTIAQLEEELGNVQRERDMFLEPDSNDSKELESVKAERDELQVAVSRLQEQLSEANGSIVDTREALLFELAELQDATTETELQVTHTVEQLKGSLSSSRHEQELAQQMLEQLKTALSSSQQDKERAQQSMEQLNTSLSSSQEENQRLRDDIKTMKEAANSQADRIRALEDEKKRFDHLRSDLDEVQKEKELLNKKLQALKDEISKLERSSSKTKRQQETDLKKMAEELRGIEEDNRALKKVSEVANEKAADLTESLAAQKRDNKKLQDELKNIARESAKHKNSAQKLEKSIQEHVASAQRKAKKLDKAKAETKQVRTKLERRDLELEEARVARDSAQQSLKELESLGEGSRKSNEKESRTNIEKLDKVTKDLILSQKEGREKGRQLEQKDRRIDQLVAEMRGMQQTRSKEAEAMKMQIALLDERAEGLRRAYSDASSARKSLDEQLKEARDENDRLKDEVASFASGEKVRSREVELATQELSTRAEQLENKLASAESERNDLSKQIKEARNALGVALETAAAAQSALEKAECEKSATVKGLAEILKVAKGGAELGKRRRIDGEQQDPLDLIAELKTWVDNAAACQEEAIKAGLELEAALEDSHEYSRELRNTVEAKNDDLIKLRGTFNADKKELMAQLLQLEGVVDRVARENTKTIEKLRKELGVGRLEARDLRDDLDSAKKDAGELREELDAAQNEAKGLRGELESAKTALEETFRDKETLEKDLIETKASLETLQAKHIESENDIKNLQKSLHDMDEENKALRSSLAESDATLAALKDEHSKLVEEHDALQTNHRSTEEDLKQSLERADVLDAEKEALQNFLDEIVQERDDTVKLKGALEKCLDDARTSVGALKQSVAMLDSESNRLNNVLSSNLPNRAIEREHGDDSLGDTEVREDAEELQQRTAWKPIGVRGESSASAGDNPIGSDHRGEANVSSSPANFRAEKRKRQSSGPSVVKSKRIPKSGKALAATKAKGAVSASKKRPGRVAEPGRHLSRQPEVSHGDTAGVPSVRRMESADQRSAAATASPGDDASNPATSRLETPHERSGVAGDGSLEQSAPRLDASVARDAVTTVALQEDDISTVLTGPSTSEQRSSSRDRRIDTPRQGNKSRKDAIQRYPLTEARDSARRTAQSLTPLSRYEAEKASYVQQRMAKSAAGAPSQQRQSRLSDGRRSDAFAPVADPYSYRSSRMSSGRPASRPIYNSMIHDPYYSMADDRRGGVHIDPEVFDSPQNYRRTPAGRRYVPHRGPSHGGDYDRPREWQRRNPMIAAPESVRPPRRPYTSSRTSSSLRDRQGFGDRDTHQPRTGRTGVSSSSLRSDPGRSMSPSSRPLRRPKNPNALTLALESICDPSAVAGFESGSRGGAAAASASSSTSTPRHDPPTRGGKESLDVSGDYQDMWEDTRSKMDRVLNKLDEVRWKSLALV
eukprot:Sro317_g115770.1 kinesin K39 (7127) ;mRNA; f:41236-62819